MFRIPENSKSLMGMLVLGLAIGSSFALVNMVQTAWAHENPELAEIIRTELSKVDYACYPVDDIGETHDYMGPGHLTTIDVYHLNPLLSGEGEGSQRVVETGVVLGGMQHFCTPVIKVARM